MDNSDKLPDGHHSGEEILEKFLLKFYNLKTLEECHAYMNKPIYTDFSHVKEGELLKVFMVAEKNLMSEALASRLGHGFVKMRYYERYGLISIADAKLKDPENKLPFLKICKFYCELFGRKAEVLMAATNGHLLTDDFAEHLDNPEDAFIYDIFQKFKDDIDRYSDVPISVQEFNQRKNQSKNFRELAASAARGSDALVLLPDNDNPGERIGFEIYHFLFGSLKTPPTGNKMDVVYRAVFSSANQVPDSLRNLRHLNFDKFLATILQHHIDLIVGKSITRVLKMELREVLPLSVIKDLPFGPCQTTALAMCVEQYLRKQACQKHVVEITLNVNGKKLKAITAEFDDKQSASDCCTKIQGLKCQYLEERTPQMVTVSSPLGLKTLNALHFFSKFLQMSPHDTAKILQNLYERGYLTYVRTESTKYPSDMFKNDEMRRVLLQTINHINIKNDTRFELHDIKIEKTKNVGIDAGDHPPIMPCIIKNQSKLKGVQSEVYDIICSWFIASFMEDYKFCEESYIFGINGVTFNFKCQKEVQEGFTKVLPQIKTETTDEDFSSIFIQGAEFVVENIEVKRSPFAEELLDECTLIKKMDENRIGTDGSVPDHMYNMEKTKYVKPAADERRKFEPTELGINLIELYKTCIKEFIQPEYRHKFMKDCEEVGAGRKSFVDTYNHYLKDAWKFLQLIQAKFDSDEIDLKTFEKCFDRKPDINQEQR